MRQESGMVRSGRPAESNRTIPDSLRVQYYPRRKITTALCLDHSAYSYSGILLTKCTIIKAYLPFIQGGSPFFIISNVPLPYNVEFGQAFFGSIAPVTLTRVNEFNMTGCIPGMSILSLLVINLIGFMVMMMTILAYKNPYEGYWRGGGTRSLYLG